MPNIALVAIDSCMPSSLSGPLDIFAIASSKWLIGHLTCVPPLFEAKVVAAPGRSVRTFTGEILPISARFSDNIIYDIIYIPVIIGNLDAVLADMETIEWLVEQSQKGACLCSVCAGSFLLAQTGILHGRKATTHWQLADEFARRFPDVILRRDKLLVDEGTCVTAGGISAYLDLTLHLTARFGSPELAATLSRTLLIDPVRRSQSPYSSCIFRKNHGDSEILRIQNWLDDHFQQQLSIGTLAGMAYLGERTFMRRFKRATGETPLAYIQQLRMEAARRLLESSRLSIEEITLKAGYEDVSSFRKLFSRHTGLSPSTYRKKFSQCG
jgi:transcriptional regulator GlxA family with amidase domain